MHSLGSPKRSARHWRRLRIPFLCSSLLLVGAGRLLAQDAAIADALAGVLALEDARRFDATQLSAAAHYQEALVRRQAALAIGRIGDPRGTPILLDMLSDPDTTVVTDAAFALGIMGDTTAIPRLRDLALNTPPDDQGGPAAEAVAAIARIGGRGAVDFYRELLGRWVGQASSVAPPSSVDRAVQEAWRLGTGAPVDLLVEFTASPLRTTALGAIYSLARLRPPAAANVLLTATESPDPDMRAEAVRALVASYADSTGLGRDAMAARVQRLVPDTSIAVRINALRTLGTYRDSTLVPVAQDRLSDPDPNVRVQAVETIGDLGGATAAQLLRREVKAKPYAVRRQAVVGLARVAGVHALDVLATWLTDPDWASRAAGSEALGYITADTVVPWIEHMTHDPDGRVVAVALTSLIAVAPEQATARAKELVTANDPVVRSIAADRLASAPDSADIGRLVTAYQKALNDPIPDARISIVGALGRIAALGFAERIAVERRFLDRFPRSADYLVRRAAAARFPEAARRWGPPTPIATGRSIEDYRDIAQRLLMPAAAGTHPSLIIDTDRGSLTIELFPEDAPVTVNAFLELVDRRYFDNGRWQRVVPNFVAQDGDPRGDGWGGPGYTLRDELNPLRYTAGTVGVALSGPDTGGSQFFITHSPQPHLDGTYTVIGRVTSGMDVLPLITQGDRIRQIRRQ